MNFVNEMCSLGFGYGGATMFGCLQDAITYGEWYNGYGTGNHIGYLYRLYGVL